MLTHRMGFIFILINININININNNNNNNNNPTNVFGSGYVVIQIIYHDNDNTNKIMYRLKSTLPLHTLLLTQGSTLGPIPNFTYCPLDRYIIIMFILLL